MRLAYYKGIPNSKTSHTICLLIPRNIFKNDFVIMILHSLQITMSKPKQIKRVLNRCIFKNTNKIYRYKFIFKFTKWKKKKKKSSLQSKVVISENHYANHLYKLLTKLLCNKNKSTSKWFNAKKIKKCTLLS